MTQDGREVVVHSVIGDPDGRFLLARVRLLRATGVRPLIDDEIPMDAARRAFERMAEGDLFGKLVLTRD